MTLRSPIPRPQLSLKLSQWRLFIFISRESKWGTLKSAGNPRCAVPAESHSICTDRRRPGPAAALQVSPTSDTCQSVAILMNRPHWGLCFHRFPHRWNDSQKSALPDDKNAKLATNNHNLSMQSCKLELFPHACKVSRSCHEREIVSRSRLLLRCLFNPTFRHRWSWKLCSPLKTVVAVITRRRTQVFLGRFAPALPGHVCHSPVLVLWQWVSSLRAVPVTDVGVPARGWHAHAACKENRQERHSSSIDCRRLVPRFNRASLRTRSEKIA